MKITVYLLAFGTEVPVPERIVDVPDNLQGSRDDGGPTTEELLEQVFFYGQNDFQPKPIRSVSCGDVVRLPDGGLFKVLGAGWEAIQPNTDINTLPRGREASLC
jgi:hypothetical protein